MCLQVVAVPAPALVARLGEMTRPPLTERELAYFAGVIDVMGTMRVRDVRGTELPFVEVNCPNLPLLEWLADKTGTGVTKVRRDYKRNGCADHCPEPHVHIESSSGRWSVSGVRATVVLHNLLPYLQLQVETAMDVLAKGLWAPRKPATVTKMTELGWATPDFQPQLRSVGSPARPMTAG